MLKDINLGDVLLDPEINLEYIIIGEYKDFYEAISFNGSDFDTTDVKKSDLWMYEKTTKHFNEIAEMIKKYKS